MTIANVNKLGIRESPGQAHDPDNILEKPWFLHIFSNNIQIFVLTVSSTFLSGYVFAPIDSSSPQALQPLLAVRPALR